jgi:ubiquinone/menaquinone biosynthesis C-methylase UbiE
MTWWDTCFDELYLRMFDAILSSNRTTEEVAGTIGFLDLPPGARILDVGCGHGRHAVPLARAGYRITGLDRSAYMLARAQEAADAAGAPVTWVRGDMRHLPFGARFDACLSLFTTIGYFEAEDENEAVVHEMGRVLKPGGRCLIDVSNRDYYLLRLWPTSWRRYGRAVILEETAFDPETCRFHMTFTWVEGERRERLTHSVRHYTAPELRNMVRRAGLEPTAVYGDFDGRPLTLDSQRIVVVARKPGA